MSYAELFFKKKLHELNYEDIENYFIDAQEESNLLELKSYAADKDQKNDHSAKEKKIYETICGLLNSEGGIIIWGAPVGKKAPGKKEQIFQGELSPVTKLIEKDGFIRTIAQLFSPVPNGVRFQMLKKNEGSYVYVIEVEDSLYKPHQYKGTYFMRLDGQTHTAPHYYVEALIRRITFPNLEGYLRIDGLHLNSYDTSNGVIMDFTFVIYNWTRLQNEYDIYCKVVTDAEVNTQFSEPNKLRKGHEIIWKNAAPILYYHNPLIIRDKVFFKTQELQMHDFKGFIIVFFGGKQSPLKYSKYRFMFANLYANNPHSDNNAYIIDKIENKYTHEMDIRDSDQIKGMIGR
ncbi:AlbA family DNA-binding domain-containing protein [Runella aurantiaca]|uniref:ATP-binding protein n=1 Tax=Runella aurantiaca TaxID=2282308 RepID=A0A369I8L1_9BACT|nr:ATP-binding protein [Runella aurantiaca]RDB06089.1 ATP-binding protein [Runella aurantiaca]